MMDTSRRDFLKSLSVASFGAVALPVIGTLWRPPNDIIIAEQLSDMDSVYSDGDVIIELVVKRKGYPTPLLRQTMASGATVQWVPAPGNEIITPRGKLTTIGMYSNCI